MTETIKKEFIGTMVKQSLLNKTSFTIRDSNLGSNQSVTLVLNQPDGDKMKFFQGAKASIVLEYDPNTEFNPTDH